MPYLLLFPFLLFSVLVLIIAKFIAFIVKSIAAMFLVIAYSGAHPALRDMSSPDVDQAWAVIGLLRNIDDYSPGITSLLPYAAAVMLLLTLAGAFFMSSRKLIARNLLELSAGNIVFEQLRSIVPHQDWDPQIRLYYNSDSMHYSHDVTDENGLSGFNDLFAKTIIMWSPAVKMAFGKPSDFLFWYFHEIAHINRRDTLLANTFYSWRGVVFVAALLANGPLIMFLSIAPDETDALVWAGLTAYALVNVLLFIYFYTRLFSMWLHHREYDADMFAFRKTGIIPRRLNKPASFRHPSGENRLLALKTGHFTLNATPALFFTIVFALEAGLHQGITWCILGLALLIITVAVYKGVWRVEWYSILFLALYIAAASLAALAVVRSTGEWLGLEGHVSQWLEYSMLHFSLMATCGALYIICLLAGRRSDGS